MTKSVKLKKKDKENTENSYGLTRRGDGRALLARRLTKTIV